VLKSRVIQKRDDEIYQWAGTSIFTRGTPPSRDQKMSHFELSCQMGEWS